MVSQIRISATYWQISLAIVLLVVCGCGRSDLGRVSGKVMLDGEPVGNAFVEFSPVTEGSISSGRTNDDGEYSLMFSRDQAGASLGEHIVRITTHDILDQGGKEVYVKESIPSRYNSNSELTVVVEQGSNTCDFNLQTSGGEIAEPKYAPGL